MKAKVLHSRTGLPDIQKDIFEKHGLLTNLDLLIDLESVWSDFLEYQKGKEGKGVKRGK